MFERLFKSARRSLRQRQQPLRTQLTLEGLEERLVPAGTVTLSFANGVVSVLGDANDNAISITQVASDGYTITGEDDGNSMPTTIAFTGNVPNNTDITGVGSDGVVLFGAGSGVTGFNIQMGGGTDSFGDEVDLIGDGMASTQLAGNMIVSSTGALTFTDDHLADFNVGGALEINHTLAGQSLDVELASEEESYGSILIDQGSGDTNVNITGASSTALFQVAGNLTLNLIGGDNFTTLGGALSIAGNLLYVGGTGNDSVALSNSSTFATGPVTIGGNASMNMGGASGSDTLAVFGAQIQGNLTTSGGGSESYGIGFGTTIGGYASLNSSGTGGTLVDVFGSGGTTATTLSSFLSVVTGSGTNVVEIQGGTAGSVAINGDVGVSIGGGSLSMQIDDANTFIQGNVFVNTGSVSTVSVQIGGTSGDGDGGTIGGYASINAAGASSTVSVLVDGTDQTAGTEQISGFLSVVSGKGNDSIQIDNGATIGSDFGYNLGSGAATVFISGTGTNIAGNVFQQDPGAGVSINNFGLVAGATVGGYVSVNSASASGAAQVVIDGTGVATSSDQIGNFLSVTTGGGNDTVTLNATAVGDNFGFELGAGSDLLQTSGDTTINGAFFGNLGSGNDKMLIQTNLNAVTFTGIGTVFTGAGTSGNFTVNGSMNPVTVYANGVTIPQGFINTGSGNDSVQLGANAVAQFIYAFSQPAILVGSGTNSTLNTNLINGTSTSTAFPGGSDLQVSGFTKFE